MSFPRYRRYRDSGIEWVGEIPAHWEVHRGRHLFQQLNLAPESEDQVVTAFRDGQVTLRENRRTEGFTFAILEIGYQRVREGDLVIHGMDAFAGAIGVSESTGKCTPEYTVLTPANPDVVNAYFARLLRVMAQRDFIYVICPSVRERAPRFRFETFKDVVLPLPPRDEQESISEFLERETAKIDALVAEQRHLVKLLREKRQAIISQAVTKGLHSDVPVKSSGIDGLGDVPQHWVIGPIKRFMKFRDSQRIPLSTEERSYRQGEFPYYGASGVIDFVDDFLFDQSLVLVSEDGANLVNRATPIAFVATGKYWVNNHAHVLEPPDRNPEFWAARIESIDLSPFVTGSAQPKFTAEALGNLLIAVPPSADERAEILEYFQRASKEFDALIAEAQRAIDLLQDRRTAVISAAVTGQIDVRSIGKDSLPVRKPYTSWFARQLLAAEILHSCHAHPTTGRVKLQKLIHLCEHVAEIEEVHGTYARKAAGPFDHKVMFGIASGLKRLEWFAEEKTMGRTVYRPLAKAGDHAKYLARWKDKLPKIHQVLDLLGTADTQQCEIVSTLYAAWNDLIIEGKPVTDAAIIHEASSPEHWHENKALIPADKWPKALDWMRQKGLVPTGFGSHTKCPQPSAHVNGMMTEEKETDEPA